MAWVLPVVVVVVVDGGTSHQEMENYENIPLSLRLLAIRLLTV